MNRSELMQRIKPRDNKSTERRFRSALMRAGAGGWTIQPDIPEHPDLAFMSERVAVFLDGCFWHGCDDHYKPPKTRADYWARKVKANKERDARTLRALVADGWKVFRVWEHDLEDPDTLRGIALRVARAADTPDALQFGRAVDVLRSEYEPLRPGRRAARCARHPIEQGAENAYDHMWRTWEGD